MEQKCMTVYRVVVHEEVFALLDRRGEKPTLETALTRISAARCSHGRVIRRSVHLRRRATRRTFLVG